MANDKLTCRAQLWNAEYKCPVKYVQYVSQCFGLYEVGSTNAALYSPIKISFDSQELHSSYAPCIFNVASYSYVMRITSILASVGTEANNPPKICNFKNEITPSPSWLVTHEGHVWWAHLGHLYLTPGLVNHTEQEKIQCKYKLQELSSEWLMTPDIISLHQPVS